MTTALRRLDAATWAQRTHVEHDWTTSTCSSALSVTAEVPA